MDVIHEFPLISSVCGNYVQNGQNPIANPGPNDCAMACGGNSRYESSFCSFLILAWSPRSQLLIFLFRNYSEVCGGPNRLTIYTTQTNLEILPAPAVKTTGLPGQWNYTGCYAYV